MGGGGSYLTTTYNGGFNNLLAASTGVTGDGSVSIEFLGSSVPLPEPGTAGLIGAAAALGLARRRRS
jgi:hypothetical protein